MSKKPTLLAAVLLSVAVLATGCSRAARSNTVALYSHLDEAKTLYEQNRIEQAADIFEEIAKRAEQDSAAAEEAYFYLAECFYKQHNYVDAHYAYKKVLQIPNGQYFETAVRREFMIGAEFCTGNISTFWRREGFGAEVLKLALEYQPFGEYSAQARLILGNYYFEKEAYDEALFHYDILIKEFPDTAEASQAQYRRELSQYHKVRLNRYDEKEIEAAKEGLEQAKQVVESRPQTKADQERLADIQNKLEELRAASAKENYEVARFFEKNDNKQAAAIYYNQVLEDAPGSVYAEWARNALKTISEDIAQ